MSLEAWAPMFFGELYDSRQSSLGSDMYDPRVDPWLIPAASERHPAEGKGPSPCVASAGCRDRQHTQVTW